MSIVMAIKSNDEILIGCDGVTSSGDTTFTIKGSSHVKFTPVNGSPSCFIGCCGDTKYSSLLSNYKNLFDGKTDFSLDYLVSKIIPKIMNICLKFNYTNLQDDLQLGLPNLELLFVTPTKIFIKKTNDTAFEVGNIGIIGIGTTAALNFVLCSTSLDYPPEELLIKSLQSAVKYQPEIKYPLFVSSTKREYNMQYNEDGTIEKINF